MHVQIGEKEADHAQFLRAENDNVTPRTVFEVLPPESPGSDLLYQSAAAYAAGALALKEAGGNAQLATRATEKAKELFETAKANPGLFCETIPQAEVTYENGKLESYGFWAATWLYRLTEDATYQTVRRSEKSRTKTSIDRLILCTQM